LAHRIAVLGCRRDARFRRPEERAADAELLPTRSRARAPLQDRQAAAVDRGTRVQRAQRVPSRRRPGEHRLAGVRLALQPAVPPVPAATSLRTLMATRVAMMFLAAFVVVCRASAPDLGTLERAVAAEPENMLLGAEYRQAVIATGNFDRSIDFFE